MVRVLLRFPEKIVDQPIIAQVLLQHQITLNIIAAHVDFHGGSVLVEIPKEHVEKAVNAFKERGVIVSFPKLIEVDQDRCLSCGACYSLCPVGAISIGEEYSISFDMEKCIGSPCGLCVDACPARVIKLTKEPNLSVLDNEEKKSN